MFDMLTADQLFRLHTSLYQQGKRVHERMITPDGHPRISVFSEAWAVLAACHAELTETQQAVGAELRRRRAEILPHDEGTSYCTSIPEKCPIHDA